MINESGVKKQIQREQRRILQTYGLEKEFRRLQRTIKKEMNGAEIIILNDILPEHLGEQSYIAEISKDKDVLGVITALTPKELLKKVEEFINE